MNVTFHKTVKVLERDEQLLDSNLYGESVVAMMCGDFKKQIHHRARVVLS
jgi:hypothetical protein